MQKKYWTQRSMIGAVCIAAAAEDNFISKHSQVEPKPERWSVVITVNHAYVYRRNLS